MRTHLEHREQLAWLDPVRLAPLLNADALAVLRCEATRRAGVPTLVVDVMLSADAGYACVPFVYVDLGALLRRSAPAVVWPVQIGSPDRVALAALAAAIEERLEAVTYGRAIEGEHVIVVDERVRGIFDAARTDGALGAAPRAVVDDRLAPAIAVARWARDRRVVIRSAAGAHVAAMFCAVTDRIAIDPAPLTDPATLAWYGHKASPVDAAAAYDVAFTDAGLRAPTAPAVVRFTAGQPTIEGVDEPPLRTLPPPAAATGGSAGRIALFVRPGATWSPDADSDEAEALARAFGREGFTTRVTADPATVAEFAPDLLHVVGLEQPALVQAAIAEARRRGAAVVVSPLYDDPPAEGWWGTVASAAIASAVDETERDLAMHLLAQRALTADGWPAVRRFATPAADAAMAAIVRGADAVVAQSAAEAAAIRTAWDVSATVVGTALEVAAGAEPLGPLTGADPFILVHAPVRPAANLAPVVLGAARVRAPLVIAGPLLDASYRDRLQALGGASLVLLDEPTPGIVTALYRAARVYVDVAWAGRGESRVALARRRGATVVRERRRGEGAGVVAVDRADAASVGARIGDAWFAPSAAAAGDGGGAAVRAVLAAYASAVRQPSA